MLPASLLAPALQQVFLGVAIAAVLLLATVLLMPAGSRTPGAAVPPAPRDAPTV